MVMRTAIIVSLVVVRLPLSLSFSLSLSFNRMEIRSPPSFSLGYAVFDHEDTVSSWYSRLALHDAFFYSGNDRFEISARIWEPVSTMFERIERELSLQSFKTFAANAMFYKLN